MRGMQPLPIRKIRRTCLQLLWDVQTSVPTAKPALSSFFISLCVNQPWVPGFGFFHITCSFPNDLLGVTNHSHLCIKPVHHSTHSKGHFMCKLATSAAFKVVLIESPGLRASSYDYISWMEIGPCSQLQEILNKFCSEIWRMGVLSIYPRLCVYFCMFLDKHLVIRVSLTFYFSHFSEYQ